VSLIHKGHLYTGKYGTNPTQKTLIDSQTILISNSMSQGPYQVSLSNNFLFKRKYARMSFDSEEEMQ